MMREVNQLIPLGPVNLRVLLTSGLVDTSGEADRTQTKFCSAHRQIRNTWINTTKPKQSSVDAMNTGASQTLDWSLQRPTGVINDKAQPNASTIGLCSECSKHRQHSCPPS